MRLKETGSPASGDLPLTVDFKWVCSGEKRTAVVRKCAVQRAWWKSRSTKMGSECGSGQVASRFKEVNLTPDSPLGVSLHSHKKSTPIGEALTNCELIQQNMIFLYLIFLLWSLSDSDTLHLGRSCLFCFRSWRRGLSIEYAGIHVQSQRRPSRTRLYHSLCVPSR